MSITALPNANNTSFEPRTLRLCDNCFTTDLSLFGKKLLELGTVTMYNTKFGTKNNIKQ